MLTQEKIQFITRQISVEGVLPSLTMEELNQLAVYASIGLRAAPNLNPSHTIDTQYGPHDLSKPQDWLLVNFDTYDPKDFDERTFVRINDGVALDLQAIHQNKIVYNATEKRLVKNRTGLRQERIEKFLAIHCMRLMRTQMPGAYTRIYNNIVGNVTEEF